LEETDLDIDIIDGRQWHFLDGGRQNWHLAKVVGKTDEWAQKRHCLESRRLCRAI